MITVVPLALDTYCMSPEKFGEVMDNYDYEIVDLNPNDHPDWENDESTIVFRLKGMSFGLAMEFAADLANMRADECELLEIGGCNVFRLFWD
jgi:hypothetical protein